MRLNISSCVNPNISSAAGLLEKRARVDRDRRRGGRRRGRGAAGRCVQAANLTVLVPGPRGARAGDAGPGPRGNRVGRRHRGDVLQTR